MHLKVFKGEVTSTFQKDDSGCNVGWGWRQSNLLGEEMIEQDGGRGKGTHRNLGPWRKRKRVRVTETFASAGFQL